MNWSKDMKTNRPYQHPANMAVIVVLLLVVLAGTACRTVPLAKPKAELYEPSNYSASRTYLAPELVNVAVITPEAGRNISAGHDETLNILKQIYRSELMKTHAFAVRVLDSDTLNTLTGYRKIYSDHVFSKDFFKILREQLNCQAVLLSELTSLKTMAPMKMGWHMKLIDTDTLETIWENDEFYDAGNIHVAAAAQTYYETQLSAAFRKPDPELVLASPRLFGQYTLDSVFSTLPPRK